MTTNQRFSFDDCRYIVDRLIVDRLIPTAKYPTRYCWEGAPEDDMHLREQVLWSRLDDLVADLIINTNPMEKLPDGEVYQPFCKERRSIFWALFNAIASSHLNALDVVLSLQHRFGGKLKRGKTGWQDFTSLSLFVDDVERLLRDLYGELDNEAINRVRDAVFCIVEEFTRYLRKDLWQEHQDAVDIDYMCGISVVEGDTIGGIEYRRGLRDADDLELRARAVRANPAAFSKYTVGFVHELFANWRRLGEPTEDHAESTEESPF